MSDQPFDLPALPLTGVRLIEASAGTGKTFSLAGLYLRLIIEQHASVREILVCTFTRPATKELRERIRQRLVAAARLAGQPPGSAAATAEDALAEQLIAGADEPRAEVARRLADAAKRMDEATITTLHGFSQRAAQENAFDSALPFDRGDQVDDHAVHQEVIGDYWRARALGNNALPGFAECWPTPADLDKALKPLRTQPHAALAGPGDAEIAQAVAAARRLWAAQGEEFAAELRSCWHARVFKRQGLTHAIEAAGGIDAAIDELNQRLAAADPAPAMPEWVARLSDPDKEVMKRQLERGTALFAHAVARALQPLPGLTRLAALRAARAQTAAMAAARKRERRQFSFADMIAALHQAITDPDSGARLADALHATWPWALVDEFQDTDPWQYETLHRIYAGRDHGALILIGDPKQAIYGFRGGDVFAYLKAARTTGASVYGLATNFRSTQGLLDGIEALFRTPGDDPFLVAGIDYRRVTAGQRQHRALIREGTAMAPLTIWPLEPEDTRKPAAEHLCRQACLAEVRQLLDPDAGATIRSTDPDTGAVDERPLAARDVAVLVNTNAEAAAMQRALSRLGLGAVCLHQQSVLASAEARDVLHVLRAAATPMDEGRLRAALAGPLLGYRLSDLIAVSADEERWRDAVERLQRGHEAWRDSGVLALLQPLIQNAAERLLAWDDGDRRMANYLQLAEHLAAAEAEAFGMAGLLRWLREAIQEADEDTSGNSEQLRLESDEALIRIVTVHKAKGLEYPVVLMPFAPWLGAKGNPGTPPLAHHDANNHAVVDILGLEGARERAIREARAEGLRLLYVALTRAEIACFLPWGAANGTANSALASLLHRDDGIAPDSWPGSASTGPLSAPLARQRLDELAARAPDAIGVEPLPERAATAEHLAPAAPPTGHARSDLPAPRPHWSAYSFTRLVRAAGPDTADTRAEDEAPTELPEATPPVHPAAGLPGGAAFGSAVHALLEGANPTAWPTDPAPLSAVQAAAVAATLRSHGIAADTDTVHATAALVGRALHTPLPGIGALAALPPAARLPEMEFMLRLGGTRLRDLAALLDDAGYAPHLPRERLNSVLGGLLHGYIDLTVEHDGRFHVIDYKTNYLGPHPQDYEARALAGAVRQRHYDLQYLLYLTALHRHLRLRLAEYDPAQHLGGAYDLFLRGMAPDAGTRGVHHERPDPELIERLDALLDGAEVAA